MHGLPVHVLMFPSCVADGSLQSLRFTMASTAWWVYLCSMCVRVCVCVYSCGLVLFACVHVRVWVRRIWACVCVWFILWCFVLRIFMLDIWQIFLTRFPERYWPGKFDVFVSGAISQFHLVMAQNWMHFTPSQRLTSMRVCACMISWKNLCVCATHGWLLFSNHAAFESSNLACFCGDWDLHASHRLRASVRALARYWALSRTWPDFFFVKQTCYRVGYINYTLQQTTTRCRFMFIL